VVVEAVAAASEGVVTEVPAVSGGEQEVDALDHRWRFSLASSVLLVGFDVGNCGKNFCPEQHPFTSFHCSAALENLSGDQAQEYFTDGNDGCPFVTELAQISSLRVISRTSVMRYKVHASSSGHCQGIERDGIVEGSVANRQNECESMRN